MASQRPVLVLGSDPLVAEFYVQIFERLGLRAGTANDLETAISRAHSRLSSMVFMDLLHSDFDTVDFVRTLRSKEPKLPVLVFAENPRLLAEQMLKACPTLIKAPESGAPADVYRQVDAIVGADPATALTAEPSPAWVERLQRDLPQILDSLRIGLLELSKDPAATVGLGLLLHQIARRTAILGARNACKLAVAMENLLQKPVCSSLLRTMGEGLDTLALLLQSGSSQQCADLSQAKVLVFASDEESRTLISSGISENRFEVLVSTPKETNFSEGVDLIVLSASSADTRGFEVCQKLRENNGTTPVLLVGETASVENKIQAKLCGANEFLGQPFQPEELALKALLWIVKARMGRL